MNINLLTLEQAAARLGISQAALSRLLHAGEIPAIRLRVGQRLTCFRVARADIERFVTSRGKSMRAAGTGMAERSR